MKLITKTIAVLNIAASLAGSIHALASTPDPCPRGAQHALDRIGRHAGTDHLQVTDMLPGAVGRGLFPKYAEAVADKKLGMLNINATRMGIFLAELNKSHPTEVRKIIEGILYEVPKLRHEAELAMDRAVSYEDDPDMDQATRLGFQGQYLNETLTAYFVFGGEMPIGLEPKLSEQQSFAMTSRRMFEHNLEMSKVIPEGNSEPRGATWWRGEKMRMLKALGLLH